MRSRPTALKLHLTRPVNKDPNSSSLPNQKCWTTSPREYNPGRRDFKCKKVQQPKHVKTSTTADAALLASQSKYKFHGLMFPRHDILQHPAANTLTQYATEGCPVDCGDNWTLKQLEKAIARGADPSAKIPKQPKPVRRKLWQESKTNVWGWYHGPN